MSSHPHSTLDIHSPYPEGLAVRKQSWRSLSGVNLRGILSLHLPEPRKSQFCHIHCIQCLYYSLLLVFSSSTSSFNAAKDLHRKFTRVLTYIIWEDISSCFNSNNVWVVIEDFKSYRTMILVCKRHKMTTKVTAKFWPLMFNECQLINLPSAFLWKFSFTSSLACKGYTIRMECQWENAHNRSNKYTFYYESSNNHFTYFSCDWVFPILFEIRNNISVKRRNL